jgi:predicted regulator of Ras-like GTPase activity (Roadblock/LC7/MglB family)
MSVLSYFDQVRIKSVEDILHGELIDAGMHQAILTDTSGNIVAQYDSGDVLYDAMSLAVLAANNIGSLSAMSRIIGEEDFPMFIIKGENDNIHFNKVTHDLFLITIFHRDLSVGFVRKRIELTIAAIQELIKHCRIP